MTGYLPDILLSRPTLHPWNQQYYDAFRWLKDSRRYSFGGPAPIPVSEIYYWCCLQGIGDGEEIDDLLYYVGQMDNAWLDEVTKKGARHGQQQSQHKHRRP